MRPIPTLNVNLRPCDCDGPHAAIAGSPTAHTDDCASKPIPIPCHIPRSVTFTVRLGECVCGGHIGRSPPALSCTDESDACPARPIRVSCSISGKAWKESKVTDVDNPHDPQGRWGAGTGDTWRRIVRECNDRWALVKALVLGAPMAGEATVEHLFAQRDAVFAALARRVRAEQDGDEALGELLAADMPASVQVAVGRLVQPRISEAALQLYVESLIMWVGVLEDGS